MKPKILLTLLFVVLVQFSFGQTKTYHPFPDSNAVWNYLMYYDFQYPPPVYSYKYSTYHYGLFGDTIINSVKYHKLYSNWADSTIELSSHYTDYYGATREDTLKRIYFLSANVPLGGDTTERLIYDFNIDINDTIITGYIQDTTLIDTLICTSIDSILIQNQYRKKYCVSSCTTWHNDEWIEGIGSITDLIEPYYFETVHELLCFHQNEILIYSQYPDSNCYQWGQYPPIGIKEYNNSLNMDINIYPNPSDGIFKINTKNNIPNDIYIYDLTGKMIYNKRINTQNNKIDVSFLSEGCYILQLKYEQSVINKKIIIKN